MSAAKPAGKTRAGLKDASHTLVIGVGNPTRSDDAAGLLAARMLRDYGLEGVEIFEASGEGSQLMDLWRGAGNVIVIDASKSGSEPGTVFRLDASEQTIPTRFFNYASDTFSVAEAVETARAQHALPRRLILYAIEGSTFEHGTDVTPGVRDAVGRAAAEILRELGDL